MSEPELVLRRLTLEELMRNRPKPGQSFEDFWKEQAAANEALTRSEISVERLGSWDYVFREALDTTYSEMIINDLTDVLVEFEHRAEWLLPDGHDVPQTAPAVYLCFASLDDALEYVDANNGVTCARTTTKTRTPF